jgi:hypothetical protein
MRSFFLRVILLCAILALAVAFTLPSNAIKGSRRMTMSVDNGSPRLFEVQFPLSEGYKPIDMKLRPIFDKSQLYVTQYSIPFSLSVEPQGMQMGEKVVKLPTVTKDGAGGEKVGDILRLTSCWVQGMQGSGVGSDIMNFAGMIKWQNSVFDCVGAPWQQVVDALTSNTPSRGRTVTLVFEREL